MLFWWLVLGAVMCTLLFVPASVAALCQRTRPPCRRRALAPVRAADVPDAAIFAIQADLNARDYASENQLFARLCEHVDEAIVGAPAVRMLVFGEHVGSWLILQYAPAAALLLPWSLVAMALMVLRHPFKFIVALRHARAAGAADVLTSAVFRMFAAEHAAAYRRVFSRLAQRYRAVVIAGSTFMPEAACDLVLCAGTPGAADAPGAAGGGAIDNVCLVLSPSGDVVLPLTRKRFPIDDELGFTRACGGGSGACAYSTGGLRFGVLICADGFYDASYEPLMRVQSSLHAVVGVSYLTPRGVWQAPWKGYNGPPGTAPTDAPAANSISEGEAWQQLGLIARGPRLLPSVPVFLNVFLHAHLFDLGGPDGSTLVRLAGRACEVLGKAGSVVAEICLESH